MSTPKTPPIEVFGPASKIESIVTTAVQVAGILIPEAGPALELFGLLEPEIQKGFAALIHAAHKNQPSAKDFLAQAQAIVDKAGV